MADVRITSESRERKAGEAALYEHVDNIKANVDERLDEGQRKLEAESESRRLSRERMKAQVAALMVRHTSLAESQQNLGKRVDGVSAAAAHISASPCAT